MKYLNFLALILSLGYFPSCQQSKSTDDPEKLKTVLVNFFDGISNKDFTKMQEAITDDFILYEDGLVWNIDSAFGNIKRHLPFNVDSKLSNFKIFVDHTLGDMSYFNHGDFVFKDGTKKELRLD
jgi:hypothetical protein